ncbi:hypothetical protein [Pseudomonas sp. PLMAX]|uniref:hypothetical protein n=1 Tax=Pseudomonas sp. PLMAX TaxID=2201998 RepID=UPI0038BA130A
MKISTAREALKLTRLVVGPLLIIMGISGQAAADSLVRTCTWVEQGAEITDMSPEGCIANEERSSLDQRLEAAKPLVCPKFWKDDGKLFLSVSAKTDQQVFVVARQCRALL